MADEIVETKTQLTELGGNIKTMVAKNETLEKELKEAKTVLETTKTELEEVKSTAKVTKDTLDKVVTAQDIMIAERKNIKVNAAEAKSFDELLKDALTEKTDDIAKFARKEKKSVEIELKAVGDVTTTNVTGSLWGSVVRPGIIENQKRKVHVRALLPGGPIGPGTTYTFMKENGNGEGLITSVAENAIKPQIDLDLIEANVNIETVAGWLRVTRKAMNNIPGFIAFLQSRLPEKLLRVEDGLILYGDGVTPNIKGILTAGNYVASTSTAAVLVEAIIDDISLLEDTYEREATGIVMRPADYYSFFKNKAAGSGEYDLPQGVTFVGGTLYILGIPVAPTTALTAGDYVVGDFRDGAQLLTQEGMRIEFFEQDGDNVKYNRVTVRIEETIALPVYGSDYFIKGTVPAV